MKQYTKNDLFMKDMPPEEYGFLFHRHQAIVATGSISTNVPCFCIQHSPTGFEWGYGGSGPADLSLNILEYVLRHEKFKSTDQVQTLTGECFGAAYDLHQEFKWEFVSRIPAKGGSIRYEDVVLWLAKKGVLPNEKKT